MFFTVGFQTLYYYAEGVSMFFLYRPLFYCTDFEVTNPGMEKKMVSSPNIEGKPLFSHGFYKAFLFVKNTQKIKNHRVFCFPPMKNSKQKHSKTGPFLWGYRRGHPLSQNDPLE